MNHITDNNEIFKLLSQSCGEPVYKTIGIDREGVDVVVPVFSLGYNFCDTVEGCTLTHCEQGIQEAARNVFKGFTNEEKRKLSFSPREGEFVKRAHFWAERLRPALSRKQYHIAMYSILHWYVHIKTMEVI